MGFSPGGNSIPASDISQDIVTDQSSTTKIPSTKATFDFVTAQIVTAINNADFKDSVTTAADSNITLSGEQTINGVLTSTSRVGVVGQTDKSENGIYDTAAGAWSRSADADEDSEVNNGLSYWVANTSSTLNGAQFLLITADPIVVDTTLLDFILIPRIEIGTTAGTAADGSLVFYRDGSVAMTSNLNMGSNNIVTVGDVDGRDVSVDGAKLDTIETNATIDQTDAEIRAAVEAATNSNVFTDADHNKLNGIEASADVTDEANVTDALDGATLPAVTVQGADKVLIQDVSNANILKTVTAQSIADLAISIGSFASSVSTPANPTVTNSSTFVMMGLAGSITPTNTGKVLISVTGAGTNSTSSSEFVAQIRFGTGSAPTNGAAFTGTALSNSINGQGVDPKPFTCIGLATGLTPSTAYWIDIALNNAGSGGADIASLTIIATELA